MKTISPRQEYWRRTKRLTWCLLALWIGVTYIVGWFARELNEIVILGFPVGFYMAAQGSLVIYLAIVGYYCHAMNRLDAKFCVEEGRE